MIAKLERDTNDLTDVEFDKRWELVCRLIEQYVPKHLHNDAWRAVRDNSTKEDAATCVRNLIELINLEDRKLKPNLIRG